MVYAVDLKSAASRRVGSSPTPSTTSLCIHRASRCKHKNTIKIDGVFVIIKAKWPRVVPQSTAKWDGVGQKAKCTTLT